MEGEGRGKKLSWFKKNEINVEHFKNLRLGVNNKFL